MELVVYFYPTTEGFLLDLCPLFHLAAVSIFFFQVVWIFDKSDISFVLCLADTGGFGTGTGTSVRFMISIKASFSLGQSCKKWKTYS